MLCRTYCWRGLGMASMTSEKKYNTQPSFCLECGKKIEFQEHSISIREEINQGNKEIGFRFVCTTFKNNFKLKRYHKQCFLENVCGEEYWE